MLFSNSGASAFDDTVWNNIVHFTSEFSMTQSGDSGFCWPWPLDTLFIILRIVNCDDWEKSNKMPSLTWVADDC